MLKYICLAAVWIVCSCDSRVRDDETDHRWKTQLTRRNGEIVFKAMLIDTNASSADPSKPAFMAPPPGSKPYHGFPMVEGFVMDGFKLGTVTDYCQADCADGCTIGDAFVEGPDGTRAGLAWETGKERRFSHILGPDTNRWGVYYFSVPYAVRSQEDLRRNFSDVLPKLKQLYREAKGEN